MSELVANVFDTQFVGYRRRASDPIKHRSANYTAPRVIHDVSPEQIKPRQYFLPQFDPHNPSSYSSVPVEANIASTPASLVASSRKESKLLVQTALQQFESNPNPQQQSEPFGASKLLKRYSMLQVGLVSLALLIFGGGIYASLSGVKAEHATQLQATKLTAEANAAAVTGVSSLSGAAAKPAISTVKPTIAAVSSYVVAPNLPKYLKIPSLGVDARIGSVGVTASGALGTPDNVYDTDWYNESAEPGQQGAMLIDGHISSWTAHGVFYGLKDLKAGDAIQVVRGDNTVFNYIVVKTVVYPSGSTDMTDAMTPVTAGVPGLNLISCSGDVIAGTSQFNERIVVFTQQVSSTPPS